MRIGYACQTIMVPALQYRTCNARNADSMLLGSLISHNLQSLGKALDYNIGAGIRLFRITSDLIPFGSSPVNSLPWPDSYAGEFAQLGARIRDAGLRVSMHPGQYTVLNSPRPEVVERALADLAYHNTVLERMGLDTSHKIVLHVGGVYQDKAAAIQRFLKIWRSLPEEIRRRLVIENDDKNYTAAEVFAIGAEAGIPVVFDNLHHELNHEPGSPDAGTWVRRCHDTWGQADGPQKIHYSQPAADKKDGSHSASIQVRPFLAYCQALSIDDLDIMLEVKDKNLSAVKCRLAIDTRPRRPALENEWARYKYSVLEHAPADYAAIRLLLRDTSQVPVLPFYDRLEHALAQPVTVGNGENAALHVWGYFKDRAGEREKKAFFRALDNYRAGGSLSAVKNCLLRLAIALDQQYLLASLYFVQ